MTLPARIWTFFKSRRRESATFLDQCTTLFTKKQYAYTFWNTSNTPGKIARKFSELFLYDMQELFHRLSSFSPISFLLRFRGWWKFRIFRIQAKNLPKLAYQGSAREITDLQFVFSSTFAFPEIFTKFPKNSVFVWEIVRDNNIPLGLFDVVENYAFGGRLYKKSKEISAEREKKLHAKESYSDLIGLHKRTSFLRLAGNGKYFSEFAFLEVVNISSSFLWKNLVRIWDSIKLDEKACKRFLPFFLKNGF